MKKPDIAKHAVIQIDVASHTVAINIITDKKKKIVACENVSMDEFRNLLNADLNSIMIQNTNHLIGKNPKEAIFSERDKKSRLWFLLNKPTDNVRDVLRISKIENIIHGILLSEESEQKSQEWESDHTV